MKFPEDAALVAHSAQDLQTLLNKFSSARSDFGRAISLKTTKVLSQGTNIPPTIKIDGKYIEKFKSFVYLDCSIAPNPSMGTEISCQIGKASGSFARLSGSYT